MGQRLVAALGESTEATVFASGRASAAGAALANGMAAHMLELDDIHKGSTVHAAAPVISAALAVAEREHVDGSRFTPRSGTRLRSRAAHRRSSQSESLPLLASDRHGRHVRGRSGGGDVVGLTAAQMCDALGSAGTQAAGLWEFNADGAMSKHLHPGKAAMNGILAADLARMGFTGATRILEGARGFFEATTARRTMQAASPTDSVNNGRSPKMATECTRVAAHTHTAIDARFDAACRPSLARGRAASRIAAIDIETYGPGFADRARAASAHTVSGEVQLGLRGRDRIAGGTGDTRVSSRRAASARTACAIVAVRSLLGRTRMTVRDDLTARYPAAWPTRVAITLDGGIRARSLAIIPGASGEPGHDRRAGEQECTAWWLPRFGASVAHRVRRRGRQDSLVRRHGDDPARHRAAASRA